MGTNSTLKTVVEEEIGSIICTEDLSFAQIIVVSRAILSYGPISPTSGKKVIDQDSFSSIYGRDLFWFNDISGSTKMIQFDSRQISFGFSV